MKNSSIITALIAGIAVYLCISFSQKTNGKVTTFGEVDLPEETLKTTDSPKLTSNKIEDLTLPQLFALDKETRQIIRNETFERPEETADWAVARNREYPSLKILELVLGYWAAQTPRTCIDWTENIPFNKQGLYKAIARSWAENSPGNAANWAKNLNGRAMQRNILKEIISKWAVSDPEDAARWISQNNSLDESKSLDYLYPSLLHSWFNKSPTALFTWRMAESDYLDLDSAFLVRKWVVKDGIEVFEWLKNIPPSPIASEMKSIAAHQMAESDIENLKIYINRKDIDNVRDSLTEAFTVKIAGSETDIALKKLRGLNNQELQSTICIQAAMELAGENSRALDFVEFMGFITFPKLDQFFEKWAFKDGRGAAEWLHTKSSLQNISPHLLKYLLKNYLNQNAGKPDETAAALYEILNQGLEFSLKNHTLPVSVRQKFTSNTAGWNKKREQLLQIIISTWAKNDYFNCLLYVRSLEAGTFKNLCMKAAVSNTPNKEVEKTLAMIDTYPDESVRRDLYSALALSTAKKSPLNAYSLLKKKGSVNLQNILQLIDSSVTSNHQELIKVLDQIKGSNSHIYLPYFFYKFTELNANKSRAVLSDFRSKPAYEKNLIATAAAFHDFHPGLRKKWYKTLKSNERLIVDDILFPKSEN